MSEVLLANAATWQHHQAAEERAWLVRFCTMLARNRDDAEDLAQETLVEAWRHAAKVYDPQGRRAWLAAIARNVALRWQRQQARNVRHTVSLTDLTPLELHALPDHNGDPLDDLEADERGQLLDRALGYVPGETRAALIGHYVEERPQRELAALLNINEAAVAARLQRGKAILRNVFARELRDEARVFGWGAEGWQTTRIWCPICGTHRFEGQIDSDEQYLGLRCPHCSKREYFINHKTSVIAGVKTFKAALLRVMAWADTYYQRLAAERSGVCMACGRLAPVTLSHQDNLLDFTWHTATIAVYCTCNAQNYSDIAAQALFTPTGRQFAQRYERTRLLPPQTIDVQGNAALLVSYASLDETARLNVAFERATLRMLWADIAHS